LVGKLKFCKIESSSRNVLRESGRHCRGSRCGTELGNQRPKMPIFEYVCKHCDHQFEALVFGNQKASCPKCESKELAPQLSVFAVSARRSSGSSAPSGACGTCGDPRGPGSCSMPDLD